MEDENQCCGGRHENGPTNYVTAMLFRVVFSTRVQPRTVEQPFIENDVTNAHKTI